MPNSRAGTLFFGTHLSVKETGIHEHMLEQRFDHAFVATTDTVPPHTPVIKLPTKDAPEHAPKGKGEPRDGTPRKVDFGDENTNQNEN